jgi:hypothetical protein
MTLMTLALPALLAASPAPSPAPPSPEMRRVLDAFVGDWDVEETFEVSARHRGEGRRGTATFREGAGPALVEVYRSDGSAGPLRFLGVLWWDAAAARYRFLTCANADGCEVRGTARWEGAALVNSWEEDVAGKRAAFRDAFVDISQDAFRLVSEGTADGKTIWRVVTRYTRRKGR